jgi:glycosyltransferase involved in cell wall biosynthesis
MRQRLTVLVPCKNERANIEPCIESVRQIADEILVADSGSTDGTLERIAEMGDCRVIEREYIHSGDFKNWAIPQASHPWVFIVDADERVKPELAREIERILRDPPDCDGYWIYRENYFLGHRIRFSGWRSDKVLRLFRRDLGRYVGQTDHAEIEISSGKVGKLRCRLKHLAYSDYDQYFRKFQRYTTFQAQLWYREGRRPNPLKLVLTGPLRFLHTYVIRLGFLDGLAGLQVCALTGFSSFMKQVRLWELYATRRPPEEPPVAAPSGRPSSRLRPFASRHTAPLQQP